MRTITRGELANVLATLVSETKDQSTLAKRIAAFLVETHQTRELEQLMRDVRSLREKQGQVEATITSAFPLSSDAKRQIEDLLANHYPSGSTFIINEEVNPEVLSGIKIKSSEKQLDETARGKLRRLTKAVV